MNTIAAILKSAVQALAYHSESPRLDAELLLCKVLGLSRPALIARGAELVADDSACAFEDLILRRANGTPIAYLTGCSEFWSLPLSVTPAVLVPRPETETLVESALQLMPRAAVCKVLDLGTGSGAIALSLASERPHWHITAVDRSAEALEVAAQNARALQLGNIQWRLSHWFDALERERFDLIVANPPYVAAADPALAKLAAEPAMALIAGPTGLEDLTAIIEAAPHHLGNGGWLLLEHGNTQAEAVAELLRMRGFNAIRTVRDFAGRARITLGSFHTPH